MNDVTIYPTPWRFVARTLQGVAVLGLLWSLVSGLLLSEETPPAVVLLRAVLLVAAAPAAAAYLIRRAYRGTIRVTADHLVLSAPGGEIAVPFAAIAAITPPWLPLPDPCVAIRLRSSADLGVRIGLADPAALMDTVGQGRQGLALRHAAACAHWPVRAWDRPWWKFAVFALLLALPLFRVDQIISYGSWRGQYLQQGLAPYGAEFALHWATVAMYLIMFATVLRIATEIVGIAATAAAPTRAASARRWVEWTCRALYYGAVPALLVLRFTGWPE